MGAGRLVAATALNGVGTWISRRPMTVNLQIDCWSRLSKGPD